ncbi:hypothetical protein DL98DRAFT_596123 [Cadophora sp. DSE1049]|nr:hypothetical protein DL98DRAFT_596123 [Cadophora sp. DSE1049]
MPGGQCWDSAHAGSGSSTISKRQAPRFVAQLQSPERPSAQRPSAFLKTTTEGQKPIVALAIDEESDLHSDVDSEYEEGWHSVSDSDAEKLRGQLRGKHSGAKRTMMRTEEKVNCLIKAFQSNVCKANNTYPVDIYDLSSLLPDKQLTTRMIKFVLSRIFDYPLNRNAALVPLGLLPTQGVVAVVTVAQRESCPLAIVKQRKQRFQNDLESLLQNILAHNESLDNETSNFVVSSIDLPITTSDTPGVNVFNTTLLLPRSPVSPLVTLLGYSSSHFNVSHPLCLPEHPGNEVVLRDTLAHITVSGLRLSTLERKPRATPTPVSNEENDDELQNDEIFVENQDRDIDDDGSEEFLSVEEEDLELEWSVEHSADTANDDDLSKQALDKNEKSRTSKLSQMWVRSLDLNLQGSESGLESGACTIEDLPDILCTMSSDAYVKALMQQKVACGMRAQYEFSQGQLEKIMEAAAHCGLVNADDTPNPEMEGHEAVMTYRRRVTFALEQLAAQMLSLKGSKHAAKCGLNQSLHHFIVANADRGSRDRLLRLFTNSKFVPYSVQLIFGQDFISPDLMEKLPSLDPINFPRLLGVYLILIHSEYWCAYTGNE